MAAEFNKRKKEKKPFFHGLVEMYSCYFDFGTLECRIDVLIETLEGRRRSPLQREVDHHLGRLEGFPSRRRQLAEPGH